MPMDCSKKVLEMDHLLLHCHWLILTNTKTHFTPCTTVVTSTVDCQTPSPVVDRSLRCPSSIISHEFHLSYLFELLWKVVANTWINQAVPPIPLPSPLQILQEGFHRLKWSGQTRILTFSSLLLAVARLFSDSVHTASGWRTCSPHTDGGRNESFCLFFFLFYSTHCDLEYI